MPIGPTISSPRPRGTDDDSSRDDLLRLRHCRLFIGRVDCKRAGVMFHKLLTADRERELILAAQSGDQAARDELVLSNQRFVWKFAQKHADRLRGHELEEIVNQCNLYLIDAIDRFELERGVRFLTFAGWHLLKGMNDCEESNRVVRLPRSKRNETDLFTISTIHDIDPETPNLFEAVQQGSDEEQVDNGEQIDRLRQCLGMMPERSRMILIERQSGKALKDIAAKLGITRERVRQIESKSIDELRDLFNRKDIKPEHPTTTTEGKKMRAEEVIDQLQSLSVMEIDVEISKLQQRIELLKRVLKLIEPQRAKKPRQTKAATNADGDPLERIVKFLKANGPTSFAELCEKCSVNAPLIGRAKREERIVKIGGLYEAM